MKLSDVSQHFVSVGWSKMQPEAVNIFCNKKDVVLLYLSFSGEEYYRILFVDASLLS